MEIEDLFDTIILRRMVLVKEGQEEWYELDESLSFKEAFPEVSLLYDLKKGCFISSQSCLKEIVSREELAMLEGFK